MVTQGKLEDMMHVANSCSGYDSAGSEFQSNIGTPSSKSCSNCKHFKNNKCEVNLYDKVLAGLDQG